MYVCMMYNYIYVCMYVCMQSYMFGLDMAVSFQSLWGFTLGNHQARGGIWSLRQSYDAGGHILNSEGVSAYQEEAPTIILRVAYPIPPSYKQEILGGPNGRLCLAGFVG